MKTPYDIPAMKRDAIGRWVAELSYEDTQYLLKLRDNWIKNYNAERFSECWEVCSCRPDGWNTK